METRHFPPVGGWSVGTHRAVPDCECGPRKQEIWKQASSGRGGSHQGRKLVRVSYHHKAPGETS